MTARTWIGSAVLLLIVAGVGFGLAAWKIASLQQAEAASATHAEPMEVVTSAKAVAREHLRKTTSIGTALALRSIVLRNELPGTVRQVALVPGEIVEEGKVLVALDVAVEEAELKALEAQAALAETSLGRMERASQNRGASALDVDRARAERDVALANLERTKATIARKTIRAPFRARVGLSDVHVGQFLNEGSELTTLQGVDEAVNVDFPVGQEIAAGLQVGGSVEVLAAHDAPAVTATIVAIDALVDRATRNALIRARIEGPGQKPRPGASVRVRVPVGVPIQAVAIPVSALRRGPEGDHVFTIEPDGKGRLRAHLRLVESGALLGDEVLVLHGLSAGETIAASGSFKLREGVLVSVADEPAPSAVEPRLPDAK